MTFTYLSIFDFPPPPPNRSLSPNVGFAFARLVSADGAPPHARGADGCEEDAQPLLEDAPPVSSELPLDPLASVVLAPALVEPPVELPDSVAPLDPLVPVVGLVSVIEVAVRRHAPNDASTS